MLQFDPQHRRVNIIQSAVVADAVMGALRRAVVAQPADAGGKVFVVRRHRTSITEASQILLDDEA